MAIPLGSASRRFLIFLLPTLLVGLTAEKSLIARLLSTPASLWLGKVSYALYMSHYLTFQILRRILPATRFVDRSFFVRVTVLLANLGIVLGVAAILYYLVEGPGRNLIRRYSDRSESQRK
ncbi:MAG TPA: hypothetical protein VGH90_06840 [Chthoniobacteraceae bacterium]|jgi:peptidoglycan/LPS O-acetylase OafA/YrhL